ncbi:GntR family transcriptional regulator [Spongiivirga citrea]|uniref:GntR family transcriptional regulator n=1 Tax=Spongiivirga citrea TaxID=1481457 RepID=UPI00293B94C0|nr:GntR family transcriptional regulator [Spongiivirga citrea]
MRTSKEITHINIDHDSRIPKYKQIIDSIINKVKDRSLSMGDRIPSINEVSEECLLSRDTVEKAYTILKKQKIIESVRGKGYYITKTDLLVESRVLFLINKASSYKMRIFNSFVNTLGTNARVDLFIYHCEPSVFQDILTNKLGRYDYYVIMPHFKSEASQHMGCTDEILKLIHSIPSKQLIIVDRNLKILPDDAGRIYQDFTEDICSALNAGVEKVKKYKKIILVYPDKAVYPYPKGIVTGFKRFCIQHDLDYELLDTIYEGMELQLKDLYIIIEEADLVNLVKQSRDHDFKLGEDLGVISYNDTPLKELLGITVMSTNFQKMGQEAANMISNRCNKTVKNDFRFIDRFSM